MTARRPATDAAIGRRPVNADVLRQLIARLTERDWRILRLLYEHTVLTSSQVRDLGFPSIWRAERRLRVLYLLRVVDRVRPPGVTEYHWILDEGGAEALAAERGVETKDLGWSRDRTLRAILHGQRRAHLVGVNGFFIALFRATRESRGSRALVEWWSEAQCAAEWGRFVQPDAFGEWTDDGRTIRFLLEYDRGTECGRQLTAKLPGYTRLAEATLSAAQWWLLFRFPSARRERSARRVLERGTPMGNIATAALADGTSPAEKVWLPLRGTGDRRTLGELAT